MDMIKQYFDNIHTLLGTVLDTQSAPIARAVKAVADTLERGGMVYAFGTGHSHMLAEELFYRAGGLVKVYPILDEPLMLHRNASRSSQVERLPGYAASLLDNGISPTQKDTIFIFSNSGRNAVPVEMALEMNLRGVTTVCITNQAQSSQAESRHPSGLRLYEICDVVIDNCGCEGDACMSLEGVRGKMGASSSIVGMFMAQSLSLFIARELADRGMEVPVFLSSNVDAGDNWNRSIMEKYYGV